MKINFHGAARTVTGSKHLLEVNGHRLLLDCGLFQGRRRETYERNLNFAFDPDDVDAVILSHAHIDHSGNLPNLVKRGFRGPIYATNATIHLADLMMCDSGKIQEFDVAFVNKRRAKRGEPPVNPIYTMADALKVNEHLREMAYETLIEVVPGVVARFVDAGHILGSASVILDIEEKGRKFRLWFSGDIGRMDLPLIRDPVMPDWADYMVMECTYGGRSHPHPDQAFEKLTEVVTHTVQRGGKVIIPAFAVGRTQELVYCLHRMIDGGYIPRIPIFVDSPLAVNVSDVFRAHPECYDQEAQAFIRNDPEHGGALGFDLLTYVRSVDESKALNERKDPMVVISASGMMEAGRILHHLRHNIADSRNTILIVSWQAPHTLGRRLVEGERRVKIFGEVHRRKAEVVTINGFSAHAGHDLLVQYAAAVEGRVKKIFLVHGEPKAARALTEHLEDRGISEVVYPELDSGYRI